MSLFAILFIAANRSDCSRSAGMAAFAKATTTRALARKPMYLVDTSVWVDFLRGADAPHVETLATLLDGDDIVGTAPVILQEILQGADSDERFRKWRSFFSELWCYVPVDPVGTHIAAAQLYQTCRRRAKTPRSTIDCLIAQIAIEHDLQLVHNDRDFEAIASVIPTLKIYH